MKGEWVAAERTEEVRAAAEGWKRAGAVSEGTFEEISRRYPEPRALPAALWRILTALFVSAVLLLVTFALFAAFRPGTGGPSAALLFVLAAGCGIAAELQERTPTLALRGGAGATAFWGIVFLLVGLVLLTETFHVGRSAGFNIFLVAALVLWSVAAWRWGSVLSAILAAVSLFLLLGRIPSGRLLWVAAGVALSVVFERFLDRPTVAPSHRRVAAALVCCGLLGVYAAFNLTAFDLRLVEFVRWENFLAGARPATVLPGRFLAILGTALLPPAIVLWGIRSRRVFVLDTGLVLCALSLVTLRYYVHLAPLWVVLTLAGAVLLLFALALNRWFARGSEKERDGFTADPLFADEARLRALELVPVLAAHGPEARPPAEPVGPPPRPPVEPGFQGGGGSFGGGGAGGSF